KKTGESGGKTPLGGNSMTDQSTAGASFPVGPSASIAEIMYLIRQVARYDSTVLITGESGCGKELVARRIHDASKRRTGQFVPVNCGAIPRDLLESELFGHEKGAFTGAVCARTGRFELANGGTLFLDEIGDMSLDMQVKLLRVLQERVFERVGSPDSRRANVRILAATHRDLEARVADGEFRQDLYFRLNVFPIRVPALRDRLEDLPELIDDLIRRGLAEGRPMIRFSPTAMSCLQSYKWPGNVRELQNLIERLSIMFPDRTIEREDLPPCIGERRRNGVNAEVGTEGPIVIPSGGIDLREHLSNIEKRLICNALHQTQGTVAQAARLLNLRRTTL